MGLVVTAKLSFAQATGPDATHAARSAAVIVGFGEKVSPLRGGNGQL
jgi:hypothetical protein